MSVVILLSGLAVFPAQAAFTSLHIFGDGVSTTTNAPAGPFYHGNRYANGRVWVEVLAEQQGLEYDSKKNWSYFGHYSANLVANLNNFPAPPDANTALFVVWVNNADFVYDMNNYTPYTTNNLAVWTNAINQSLTNHLTAIQTLYAKGARTLIMPNAADVTQVPFYVRSSSANRAFVRQRVIDFNVAFAASLNQASASLPGLTIHVPDIFALFDDVLADSAHYGLTNALENGLTVDALSDPALTDKSLNGPGANYIFWDYLDPTSRFHAVIADNVHQLISPVQISTLTWLSDSNRLEVANLPIGRDGFVESSPNLASWTPVENINRTNATQTMFVPASGPQQFYRLRIPFAWSWP